MKYLKKYENIEYEVGDYVKLKYIPIDATYYSMIDNIEENRFVQIIHIMKNTTNNHMFIILKTNKEFSAKKECIDRKMTKEEIEEIQIKKDANKYNI